VLHVVHQAPAAFNLSQTRWRLASLLTACAWLGLHSLPGLHGLLKRLDISLKRARAHVHSPDPNYPAKLASIRLQLQSRVDLVFTDEFTLYRQPSLAPAYEHRGHVQPLAELGHTTNRTWRFVAGLHAWTGQVTWLGASRISVGRLVAFYQKLTAAYPGSAQIHLVEDNWPLHFHPDVLAALQPQSSPWPWSRPATWPDQPHPRAKHLNLPLHLCPLPTYASWTNPIEKLWRWLQQDVLHVHTFADDWPGLRQSVGRFLDQFITGSTELLRYVGLADPTQLYRAVPPLDMLRD
jgi:hypothetical protein